MSKADYETFVVRIGRRRGEPYGDRRPLNVPWALATGNYEDLSALQLREALNDLNEEASRRSPPSPRTTPTYDPFKSQVRKPS